MEAPDSIDPCVGWRVWDVVELDGRLRLCSLAFWTIWIPGRVAEASCRRALTDPGRGGLPDHNAPAARCTCGIYATRSPRYVLDVARQFRRRPDTVHRVIGRVSLWGEVVECEGGWRGAKGYPAELIVPTARGRRGLPRPGRLPAPRLPVEDVMVGLEDYGCPVTLVDAATDRALAHVLEPRRPVA